MATHKKHKSCINGHHFYKSSDCPVCPICESNRKSQHIFLSSFSAPAQRAMEQAGITSLEKLTNYSEKEIAALHGLGKNTLLKLRSLLHEHNLSYKK